MHIPCDSKSCTASGSSYSLSSSLPHSFHHKVQTTGLKPLSEEFLVAFCKSSIVIMAASSAATHWALSWCFFWMEEVCEGDTSMKPLY